MSYLFLLCASLLLSPSAHAGPESFRDGDIIFHQSQSDQSKAIREVTRSRWSHVGILFRDAGKWFVHEAVQPVKKTPLSSFLRRGKNGHYRVYRLPGLRTEEARKLKAEVGHQMGKNYDIYFEWSDGLIYCSELVYKAYLAATRKEIGAVQKFRDLDLTGPYARELIRRRLADTGKELNPEEPIVTPASQTEDTDLVLVEKQE